MTVTGRWTTIGGTSTPSIPADPLRTGAAVFRAMVLLRRHGVSYGSLPSFVGRSPLVANEGRMQLGARVSIRAHQVRAALTTGAAGELLLGDHCYINQGAVLHAEASVSLGQHVLVGDYAVISDTDFHEVEPGQGVRTRPIVVGDSVWLARGVVVLPGAVIGEGTVVAAGSVVRGELPSWVVAAGSPARPVREITGRGVRR